MLKTKCPCCNMDLSLEWSKLNSKVYKFHTVDCSWCHKPLALSKFWLSLVGISLLTIPIGFIGLVASTRINKLVHIASI